MLKALEEDFAWIPALLDRVLGAARPDAEPEPAAPSRSPSRPARPLLKLAAEGWPRPPPRRPRRSPRDSRDGFARRRRHDLGRARHREDDLRARRRRALGVGGSGDEPDVHDRAPVRGSVDVSHLDFTASAAFRRRSGEISSRPSRTRSCSSSGRRQAATRSRRPRRGAARACGRRRPARSAGRRRDGAARRNRMTLVLAFDTATDVATGALLDDGRVLGERARRGRFSERSTSCCATRAPRPRTSARSSSAPARGASRARGSGSGRARPGARARSPGRRRLDPRRPRRSRSTTRCP